MITGETYREVMDLNSGIGGAELLAPVGNAEMAEAAIHNGASAIYIGLPGFNARNRRSDLARHEFASIVHRCRTYGLRVFVAANILIFDDEIESFLEAINFALSCHIDAIIVQDVGAACLIRERFPMIPLHASTQADIGSIEAYNYFSPLHFERVTLPRESSLADIRRLRSELKTELEVFIHGAICISFSGHCFTSLGMGGRSGNRGECAQSCRLPYRFTDALDDSFHFPFSPTDLAAGDQIRELRDSGVESFKIEGRMKSPEYVAAGLQRYGSLLNGKEPSGQELELTYHRGSNRTWFNESGYHTLVRGDYNAHRGVFLGTVNRMKNSVLNINFDTGAILPRKGDGIIVLNGGEVVYGGPVFSIEEGAAIDKERRRSYHSNKTEKRDNRGKKIHSGQRDNILCIGLSREGDFNKIRSGMKVYLTGSPEIQAGLRRTWTDLRAFKRIPLNIRISGGEGEYLQVEYNDGEGRLFVIRSGEPLEKSLSSSFTCEKAERSLGALGRTPYVIDHLEFRVKDKVFVHERELKRIRQEAVEKMTELRAGAPPYRSVLPFDLPDFTSESGSESNRDTPKGVREFDDGIGITLLIRSVHRLNIDEILDSLKGFQLFRIAIDHPEPSLLRSYVAKVKRAGFQCAIVLPRIHRASDAGNIMEYLKSDADIYYAPSAAAAWVCRENQVPFIVDATLNTVNAKSVLYHLQMGAEQVCASYELSPVRVADLASNIPNIPEGFLEWPVYVRMPAFHMEYCLFSMRYGKGERYPECGQPCKKNDLFVKDPKGAVHEVFYDHLCRNTVYLEKPLNYINSIQSASRAGVRYFRIEVIASKGNSDQMEKSGMDMQSIQEKIRTIINEAKAYSPDAR